MADTPLGSGGTSRLDPPLQRWGETLRGRAIARMEAKRIKDILDGWGIMRKKHTGKKVFTKHYLPDPETGIRTPNLITLRKSLIDLMEKKDTKDWNDLEQRRVENAQYQATLSDYHHRNPEALRGPDRLDYLREKWDVKREGRNIKELQYLQDKKTWELQRLAGQKFGVGPGRLYPEDIGRHLLDFATNDFGVLMGQKEDALKAWKSWRSRGKGGEKAKPERTSQISDLMDADWSKRLASQARKRRRANA